MTEPGRKQGADPQSPAPSLFAEADLGIRVRPAQFARMVGVSRQTVSRWIQEGKVRLYPDGTLDPRRESVRVMNNTDPSRLRAKILRPLVDDVASLRKQIAEANTRADQERARADREAKLADDAVAEMQALGAELQAIEAATDHLMDLVVQHRKELATLDDQEAAEDRVQDLYGIALDKSGYAAAAGAGLPSAEFPPQPDGDGEGKP